MRRWSVEIESFPKDLRLQDKATISVLGKLGRVVEHTAVQCLIVQSNCGYHRKEVRGEQRG